MKALLAALLVLLPAAVFAQTSTSAAAARPGVKSAVSVPDSVDLSGQFPTAADRSQGDTGTCHVFASISLLEAALFRRHGLRHPLSEADLFVRQIIMKPGYYSQVQKVLTADPGAKAVYALVEGGSVLEDARFAIANGAVKQQNAPWKDFEARYAAFEAQQLAKIGKEAAVVQMTGSALKDLKEDRARPAPAVGSDNIENIRQAHLQRVETRVAGINLEARRGFAAFLSQIEGKTAAEAEKPLLGDSPKLVEDRRAYKALLYKFTAAPWDFAVASSTNTEPRCLALGADRKKALLASFMKGIPVSVNMDLDGLPEWGSFKGRSLHAFTATGYVTDKEGGLVLKTRNSWGGDNPDIPEKRFCRISRIVVVRTDQEK